MIYVMPNLPTENQMQARIQNTRTVSFTRISISLILPESYPQIFSNAISNLDSTFSLLKFIHKALYYFDILKCFQALLNMDGNFVAPTLR